MADEPAPPTARTGPLSEDVKQDRDGWLAYRDLLIEAVGQLPDDGFLRQQLGGAYEKLGQLVEAEGAYEAAMIRLPREFGPRYRLAEVRRLLADAGGRPGLSPAGELGAAQQAWVDLSDRLEQSSTRTEETVVVPPSVSVAAARAVVAARGAETTARLSGADTPLLRALVRRAVRNARATGVRYSGEQLAWAGSAGLDQASSDVVAESLGAMTQAVRSASAASAGRAGIDDAGPAEDLIRAAEGMVGDVDDAGGARHDAPEMPPASSAPARRPLGQGVEWRPWTKALAAPITALAAGAKSLVVATADGSIYVIPWGPDRDASSALEASVATRDAPAQLRRISTGDALVGAVDERGFGWVGRPEPGERLVPFDRHATAVVIAPAAGGDQALFGTTDGRVVQVGRVGEALVAEDHAIADLGLYAVTAFATGVATGGDDRLVRFFTSSWLEPTVEASTRETSTRRAVPDTGRALPFAERPVWVTHLAASEGLVVAAGADQNLVAFEVWPPRIAGGPVSAGGKVVALAVQQDLVAVVVEVLPPPAPREWRAAPARPVHLLRVWKVGLGPVRTPTVTGVDPTGPVAMIDGLILLGDASGQVVVLQQDGQPYEGNDLRGLPVREGRMLLERPPQPPRRSRTYRLRPDPEPPRPAEEEEEE